MQSKCLPMVLSLEPNANIFIISNFITHCILKLNFHNNFYLCTEERRKNIGPFLGGYKGKITIFIIKHPSKQIYYKVENLLPGGKGGAAI